MTFELSFIYHFMHEQKLCILPDSGILSNTSEPLAVPCHYGYIKRGFPPLFNVMIVFPDIFSLRLFYGPQGPYSLFAGRDATRALALMSFDHNDLTGDLDGLSPDELEVLQDWEEKYKERYPRVGHLACEDVAGSGQNTDRLHHEEGDA